MKRLFLVAALGLMSLSAACTPIQSPGSYANKTTLDEKAAIAVEAAYTTAAKLGTVLAQNGVIDPVPFKAAESRAYGAVLAARSAYDAGNASDYAAAVQRANAAITAITDLVSYETVQDATPSNSH